MASLRPSTFVFAIEGPISREDLPGICARVCALLESNGAEVAVCEVDPLVEADAVTADALARLQLLARQLGCRVQLRNASDDLVELLAFMGLRDVVPLQELRLEPRRQPEERKQRLGVEERGEVDEPPL